MEQTCYGGYCAKCHAGKWIIGGAVLFAATWYAKGQANVYLIWYAIAVLAVLKGLFKLMKPTCPHCESPSTKKAGK